MIRPQISNAIVMSILFASLAAGATLMLVDVPLVRHAGAQKCDPPGLRTY
jgi:hypothetical protein